jgi:uncharacterized coiled-coil protein SlyX
MTIRRDTLAPPQQGLVQLALDELRKRITTLEIEVAHWERACQVLSADLRSLAADGDVTRSGRSHLRTSRG